MNLVQLSIMGYILPSNHYSASVLMPILRRDGDLIVTLSNAAISMISPTRY